MALTINKTKYRSGYKQSFLGYWKVLFCKVLPRCKHQLLKMGFHASIPTNNIHPTMSKACQCEIDTLHLLLAQACLAELVPNLAHVNLAFKHLLTVAALWQEDVWRLFINKLLPHNLLTQLCSCSSSLISSSTLTTPEQYFYFLSTQNYTIFELIQYYTIFYERKLVKIYQK